MYVQTDRTNVERRAGRKTLSTYGIDVICNCDYCSKLRKRLKGNNMTRKYNKAGLTARAHYQESDDPCDYVTDTPNPFHEQINETVDAALQRVNEIKESGADNDVLTHSLRCYQLIREMAATAGRKSEPGLRLLAAQVRAVFNQL